jgi:hypothetical protein
MIREVKEITMRKPWVGSCFHHDIHFNEDWPLENDSKGIPAPPEANPHNTARLAPFSPPLGWPSGLGSLSYSGQLSDGDLI